MIDDIIIRLRARHQDFPHRYPSNIETDGESIMWCCAACGEWVRYATSSKDNPCSVDWRGPYLEHQAADIIENQQVKLKVLQAAFTLAVGELSTHGEYAAWTPEMLMKQFLEEACNGN